MGSVASTALRKENKSTHYTAGGEMNVSGRPYNNKPTSPVSKVLGGACDDDQPCSGP